MSSPGTNVATCLAMLLRSCALSAHSVGLVFCALLGLAACGDDADAPSTAGAGASAGAKAAGGGAGRAGSGVGGSAAKAGAGGSSVAGSGGSPSKGGPAGSGAAGSGGSLAGGSAGTNAGGSAGTNAGAGAGTNTGGGAGMNTGGSAGTNAGGSAGKNTGGSAGASSETTITLPAIAPLSAGLGPRFPSGIEPGDPAVCEAIAPARCWWVDSAAAAGGDGSFAKPARSFESIVGALQGTDYTQGTIGGGDYLYVKGTFVVPATDDPEHMLRVLFRRKSQGGTVAVPTVIKSWRGSPRAVFDGHHEVNDMLLFANMGSFRMANIEIRDAGGRGVVVESVDGTAIFEDMYVHGTVAADSLGVGGGIHCWGGGGSQLLVRHNHFRANTFTTKPIGAINNVGAFSLTADGDTDGTLRVTQNVFEEETTGVRHKHAGNFDTEIANNLFWKGERGVLLRSRKTNDIHHNVFLDLSAAAIVSYVENTAGDLHASVHHNNFFDTTRLLTDINGAHNDDHIIDFHHNFVHEPTSPTAFEISFEESLPFVTGAWNLYDLAAGDKFAVSSGKAGTLDFAGFAKKIADTTSTHSVAKGTGTTVADHQKAYEQFQAARVANGIGF